MTMNLLERIEKALNDFTSGRASMHVPPLDTDVDMVLADCQSQLTALTTQLESVVAENAALKGIIDQHADSFAVCPNCSHEEPSETDVIVALYRSMETPATDAFLAEVRASGVEMAAKSEQFSTWVQQGLRSFAIGVRQGGAV